MSLIAKNLTVKYQSENEVIPIIDNINFEISSAQKVAILGSSGSGKSTLLQVFGLMQDANAGEIIIDGQVFYFNTQNNQNTKAFVRRQKIGFVYQFHYLFNDFNAIENLVIPQLALGINISEAKDKAYQMLQAIALEDKAYHFPSMLSGGQKQRIAIARALIKKPIILIADEPTGNLDPYNSQMLFEQMQMLVAENNTCLIMATHNYDFVSKFDRCYTIISQKMKPFEQSK
jgi:lipoprotein-releasing system ATP-binding protein